MSLLQMSLSIGVTMCEFRERIRFVRHPRHGTRFAVQVVRHDSFVSSSPTTRRI